MDAADKRRFFLLWGLCILGSSASLSALFYLAPIAFEVHRFWVTIFLSIVQNALIYGFVAWLGFKILLRTDLTPFKIHAVRSQIVCPALWGGIALSLIILFADHFIFAASTALAIQRPPRWAGLLASLYGSVNEEVLCRFFLLTLFYFLLRKIAFFHLRRRILALWIATLFAAILFGAAHLPLALRMGIELSGFEVFRILLLNGLPGILLGWFYWSRGIWTAMGAHFVMDFLIHVLWI